MDALFEGGHEVALRAKPRVKILTHPPIGVVLGIVGLRLAGSTPRLAFHLTLVLSELSLDHFGGAVFEVTQFLHRKVTL